MISTELLPESAQDHILRIRREKFSLDDNGRLLSHNPLAGDLHDSVDLLSAGLYSKDIHFVLELIQNAEDNAYPPQTQPELLFRMLPEDPTSTPGAKGALLLINNECGLRPQDVDALCAVGKSTKTKRQGYIGEKGIGFKSVFKVTRRPHLFSAGYQFRFDRDPDPEAQLGYIIPYWVEVEPAEVADRRGQTYIVLPLDDGQWASVIEQLRSIAPETILFLSRLEGLSVELQDAPPLHLAADKTAPPIVHLLDDEGLATYWVHSQEVICPPDRSDEKRIGIDSRVISVAFPLEVARKPDYSVFAYLPTEVQSGYPFLVNADFILSTSREAILVDRPWNGWLRDEIVPCFVEGFSALVLSPEYRYRAYGFIPLADDVPADFFKRAVAKTHAQLKPLSVVWAHGRVDPVLPSSARLAPATFRTLLEADRPLPLQLTVTPLVRSEIEQYGKQLRAIGVTALQPDEVRACLQDEAWLADRSPEWFAELFRYLQQDKWRVPLSYEREVRSLAGLPIIPTSDGRLVTVGKEAVYLPEPAAEALAREHADLLGGLKTVAFLDTDLYHLLAGQPELLDWVKREVARPWTPEAYCRDLVKALGASVANLSVADLVKATRIVRDLTEKVKGTSARELCDGLPVKLENGKLEVIRRWASTDVVTPINLEPHTGWQETFLSEPDRAGLRILAKCYLEGSAEAKERGRWAAFFEAIGLNKTPIPIQSWTWWYSHSLPADMPRSLQAQVQKAHQYSTQGYKLTDIRIPQWLAELAATGRSDAVDRRRCKALLQWLERALDLGLREPRQFLYHYYKWYYIEVTSSAQHLLQTAPWFPSTQGFRRPGELFLDREEVRQIFGDTVAYAAEPIGVKLAEWLGVRLSATVAEVLAYLAQLAERPAVEVSATLVQRIYTFLMERWRTDHSESGKEQRRQFAQRAMIRVEHPLPKWVLRDDAIWANRSDVFGDDFAYLEPDYPARLRDFFVDQLAVKADAEDELYARSWLKYQRGDDPDPIRVETALERIFPVLVRVAEGEAAFPWWRAFLAEARVWTQGNRFVSPGEAFIPDDGVLKKILGKAGAHFVWRPSKDSFGDNEALYKALGIRSLVEMATCSFGADIQTIATPAGEEGYLCAPAKRGICFYLWNRDRSKEEFKRLKDDGILAALLGAREASVDSLVLQYQLDGIRATDADAVTYFDRAKRTLYVSKATPSAKLDVEVPAHLARVLSKRRPPDGLRDFIARISGKTEQHLQYIIEQSDWRLPLEEREWMERAIADQLDLAPVGAEENGVVSGDTVLSTAARPEIMGSIEEDRQRDKVSSQVEGSGWTAPLATASEKGETDVVLKPLDATGQTGEVKRAEGGNDEQRAGVEAERERRSGFGNSDRTTQFRSSLRQNDGSSSDGEPQERRSAYVEPEGAAARHGHGMDPEKLRAIEEAGIAAVEAYEWAHGRKPDSLKGNHPGWDINSFELILLPDASPDRRIEVKAKEGAWDDWGIALTPTEYESARRYSETYYLYVVEHAMDNERRRIHVFRNPAAKATEYRFRQDWRKYADEIS